MSIDAAARLRNHFALLLAAARPHLTPLEFLRRLRLLQHGDLRLARGDSRQVPEARHRELERAIATVFEHLEEGDFPREAFSRACALYEGCFPGK